MKKRYKALIIVGSIALAISSFYVVVNNLPLNKVCEVNPYRDNKTHISAHRGGSQLNPENTQMAFDYIINQTGYADYIEIDVHLTSDNILVINHDETINRMALDSDAQDYTIKEHTYQELSNFNLGYNFVDRVGNTPYKDLTIEKAKEEGLTLMTFDSFLTKYNNARDFNLLLEIKDSGQQAKKIADSAMNYLNMEKNTWWKENTTIITFKEDILDYISEKYNFNNLSPLGGVSYSQMITSKLGLGRLVQSKYQLMQILGSVSLGPLNIRLATKRLVNEAHLRNQAIDVWNMNTRDELQYLVDLGVDVITTDAPDLLYEILNN